VLAREARRQLRQTLERARERGALGPVPVEDHLEHGEAFADAVGGDFAGRLLDLGSGAGVPGLILLLLWPEASGTLLESRRRRCALLETAARDLGVDDRAVVACGRAEELARRPELRGGHDLVVARAFGRPATTAECAVGFLQAGGRLVVSEPPGESDPGRWPAEGLAELGLVGPDRTDQPDASFAVLTLEEPPAARWPRGVGVPRKRPLWP
jgi:16S rRNA (guanine527-N7)-methyltransferase